MENQLADIDDIDKSDQGSPVISLDSISGDDSSFDQDCRSLENSWDECALDNNRSFDGRPPKIGGDNEKDSALMKISELVGKTNEISSGNKDLPINKFTTKSEGKDAPPKKPPRSLSPKVTQTTPL